MDFVKGTIWISTLHTLRDPEHKRGDTDEGKAHWIIEDLNAIFTLDQAALKATALSRHGFVVTPKAAEMIQVSGLQFSVDHPDVYVLCMSASPKMTGFGGHRVRIADPVAFTRAITDALVHTVGPVDGALKPMAYEGRLAEQAIPSTEHVVFTGAIGNEREQEWRLAWQPLNQRKHAGPLKPLLLHAPLAARFCSIHGK